MFYILWYVPTYGETFIPKTRFHGDLEEVSSGIPPFPGKGEVSYPYQKQYVTLTVVVTCITLKAVDKTLTGF